MGAGGRNLEKWKE